VLLIIAPTGLHATSEQFERLFPLALMAMVTGPITAGILLTWLVAGPPGLRELGARLVRARVGARWYAVALLLAPLYFIATALLVAVGARSGEYLPALLIASDKVSVLVQGLAVGLAAGIVEELGWTGFAVPALRRRHGVVGTGLIAGVLWGVWHFLVKIWAAPSMGLIDYTAIDLASAVIGLTGYRILMVWVYDRTRSLFIAILMHLALTFSTLTLQPAVTGARLVIAGVPLALAPWVIIAAAAVIRRRRAGGRRERSFPNGTRAPVLT
jgi:membrane protease YdiL (CAAX protease family)